jgi:ribosomal protein L37AE/L43A
MKNDFLPVTIRSELRKGNNSHCEFCHRTGRVIKVTLPTTRYHDGRKLSTKYKGVWICESCRDQLRAAIDIEFTGDAEI